MYMIVDSVNDENYEYYDYYSYYNGSHNTIVYGGIKILIVCNNITENIYCDVTNTIVTS